MTVHKHVDFEVSGWGELESGPLTYASYAQRVLELNPVAYWRLGETSGDHAFDETDAHNGQYLGNATLGRAGAIFRDANTAVLLDGSDGCVMVPHHSNLELAGATPATWLMWMKKSDPSNDDARWLMGKGKPTAGELRYLIEVRTSPSRIHMVTHNGQWHDASSDAMASFEGWRQIAVTWNGVDTLRFYHDGDDAGHVAFEPGWFASNSEPLVLGAAYASTVQGNVLFHFGGDMDEIALFDKALSAEQIADLYNRAAGVFRLT